MANVEETVPADAGACVSVPWGEYAVEYPCAYPLFHFSYCAPGPHKLEKTWSFWFKGCKPAGKGGAGKGKWDGSCGTKAYTFDTAEDFWCLYNNIKRASQIPDRSDYYLFIDGIEPKYEDEVRDNYTIPRFQVAIIACLNNKW